MACYIPVQIRTARKNTQGQAALSRTEKQTQTPMITESTRDQHGVAITTSDSRRKTDKHQAALSTKDC